MATVVDCPACRRALQVPDHLLSRLVKCPTCGETFTASAGRRVPEAAVPVEPVPDERPAPPPRRSRARDADYDDGPFDYADYGRDREPHRGAVILTLGILSLVVCGWIGPFAWSMGNADLAKIRSGRMDPSGEGLTQAGRICGIIGTIFGVLQLCYIGFVFIVMIGAAAGR